MKSSWRVDAFCDFLRMKNNAARLNGTDDENYLIKHSVSHAYAVCTLGTVCNAAALWCIMTCDKTNAAVKFLLSCIFASLLLLSLLTRPVLALNMSSFLKEGEPTKVPESLNVAACILYVVLAEGEMWCIAAVAFFRGSAVWSPRRHKLSFSAAVKVVTALYGFIILTNTGMAYLLLKEHFTVMWVVLIYCACHIVAPLLVTLSCYGAMMVAVQRSKRQLARVENKPSPALDQATNAIVAVLLSNMIIGLPHSVYHFFPSTSLAEDILYHSLFSCHYFVDPIVFLWFNQSYRNRITAGVGTCLSSLLRICAQNTPAGNEPDHLTDDFFRTYLNETPIVNNRGDVELAVYIGNENQSVEVNDT